MKRNLKGQPTILLSEFTSQGFQRGRSKVIEALWTLSQALLLKSFVPGSTHRIALLRLFGAKIGKGAVIKPGVRVKFPWRLSIGDYTWIGEDVWIDNLSQITIGSNCCISQGAYLCTGSHDWTAQTFDLRVEPIEIQSYAWIGAKSTVGPGVIVGEGSILSLGSTATSNQKPWFVFQGNPARQIKERQITSVPQKALKKVPKK